MKAMKSINVRISPQDERSIRELQADGVNISELFRKMIGDEADRRRRARKKKDVRAIIARLDAKYPVPDDADEPDVDTSNRHEFSAYIRAQIMAKQKRIQDDLARQQRAHRARRSARSGA
jgi:hypothetical protein